MRICGVWHRHLARGTGIWPGISVASQIPREVCERINLSYRDPASIDVESFADREDEGVLLVRKAGEHLYRLQDE